ncbi:hypothetical protein [Nonomuraea sp. 10N515B]|uniref:hypothetical protein n=1 Tax=Nonomuraea sp. 10N515B TaxID=3457422 RepID=UPI003FCCD2D4
MSEPMPQTAGQSMAASSVATDIAAVAQQSAVAAEGAQSGDGVSVVVQSHFKLVFLTVAGLSVLLLAIQVTLAVMVKEPTDAVNNVLTLCDTISKLGFGAIFGMIGTKAAG